MTDNLAYLSASDLLAAYRARTLSPVEVADATLRRIDRLNPGLNAFITVTHDRALEDARAAEAAYGRGDAGSLAGVPISIKDLTPTKGIRTTRGSKLTADAVPEIDGVFVERTSASGAVMIGKTNTPEAGWKGETSNPLVGPTHNPWRKGLTPGGSSGGGSAAVALGLGPLAQGSDGAGSIRIPAGFSGIFGLKPSYGLVPHYPISAVADLAHLGPMTRTVRDAALLMNATAGADARDRLSWSSGVDYVAAIDRTLPKFRIAWSPDLGYAPVDPEVVAIAERAARRFIDLGHVVESAHPDAQDPWEILDILWSTGMNGLHPDGWDEIAHLIDPGRIEMMASGRARTAAQIGQAPFRRTVYHQAVVRFFEDWDLLLTPTLPCKPFAVGLHNPPDIAGKPTTYLGWTAFTYPFNLTGNPAASVPAGFTSDGLPVGLQIVGRFQRDDTVLQASAAFEAAQPWAHITPDETPFL
jgi:aspartyl-tRNA(Asn)/glutamyl-tRNA(Gln) amidotransferase subunit A